MSRPNEHRRRGSFAFLPIVVALSLLTGCFRKSYPVDSPVVSDVALRGATAVNPKDVLAGLATAASPRFLGIWDGVVFDYEVYDPVLLERDLERIERYYRARGYYEAKVTAARVARVDGQHVRVELRVQEGLPVLVQGNVTTPGLERLPFDVAVAANRAIELRDGDPFDEAVYDRSKAGIVTALANRGYAFAKVIGHATVDLARDEAHVEFQVEPGPRTTYGAVEIVGLSSIPEGKVRDNLGLEKGEPYSRADVEDARTALINLGVFATVDVHEDLSHPEKGEVPIRVTVSEAPLKTLRLGAGMRFDVLEWSANLAIGWEHENFLGGLRKLSIDTKPGLVFFPTRMDNLEAPTHVLPRNRLRVELQQPSFFEGRTTGLFATEFNIYPVLYPGRPVTDENVIGYDELKFEAGARRPFFSHHLFVTSEYTWQANFPFAYLGVNTLPAVHVSYPSLTTVLDLRDDPIEPHRGLLVSNTVQVAGYIFGGDASDVRVQPEVRAYVPISKSVTLAARATVGFLFPSNYGETLTDPTAGTPDERNRDQQLLLFRAFYSGGPNSNRGYPFRGVGPQGVLGYLQPNNVGCNDPTNQSCLRPTGGLTLWEASLEVRFPLSGPLRLALFVDASDVTRSVGQIRFDYPHLSPGAGLRYATPIGPVRLDVGYRVPYMQEVGKALSPTEGAQPTIFGAPIAIQFGLGEPF